MHLRSVALALIASLTGSSLPALAATSVRATDKTGVITGTAATATASRLANAQVRARSVDFGVVAAATLTDNNGSYVFAGLTPGNYLVELLDAAGLVIGTSAPVIVSADQRGIRGVLVTANAANAAATGSSTGNGPFFKRKAGLVVLAAAASGVTGVLAATRETKNASPSR